MTPPLVLTPAPAATAPGPSRWARGADALTSYLPLVLMALLAAATYWLVKNTPVPQEPRPAAALREGPDYVMNSFSVQQFAPAGRPRTLIEGRELRHYPDTDRMEIDDVRVRAVDEQGRLTIATARRGLTNSDNSIVELMGGAQVVREAGGPPGDPASQRLEFRGEYLRLFPDTKRVESHLPVELRQGDMLVSGESLRYDHGRQVLELQGRVRGTLPPRGAGASTGSTAP